MNLVGARFDCYAHHSRGGPAKLRRITVGNHFEFLNRVNRRLRDFFLTGMPRVQLLVVVILTVQKESDLNAGESSDADSPPAVDRRNSTGGERGELQIVASIERQFHVLFVGDN